MDRSPLRVGAAEKTVVPLICHTNYFLVETLDWVVSHRSFVQISSQVCLCDFTGNLQNCEVHLSAEVNLYVKTLHLGHRDAGLP